MKNRNKKKHQEKVMKSTQVSERKSQRRFYDFYLKTVSFSYKIFEYFAKTNLKLIILSWDNIREPLLI